MCRDLHIKVADRSSPPCELASDDAVAFCATFIEGEDLDIAKELIDRHVHLAGIEKVCAVAQLSHGDCADAEFLRSMLDYSFGDTPLSPQCKADAIGIEHESAAHPNGFFFFEIGS